MLKKKISDITPSSSTFLFRNGSAPVIMGCASSFASAIDGYSISTTAMGKLSSTSSPLLLANNTNGSMSGVYPSQVKACLDSPKACCETTYFESSDSTSKCTSCPVAVSSRTRGSKRCSMPKKMKRRRSASVNLRLDLGLSRHSIGSSSDFRESISIFSDPKPVSAPATKRQFFVRWDSQNSNGSIGSDSLSPMMAPWGISPSHRQDGSRIAIAHLRDAINERRSDDCRNFAQEFEDIPDQHVNEPGPFSVSVASQLCNADKNRYSNILPFDHSRVCLGNNPCSESSYINACFIDGYKAQRAWVATQGPLPRTFGDFWHMIWEIHSVVIVMLACEESGRVDVYYPSVGQSIQYNDICVISKSERYDEVGVLREFVLRRKIKETDKYEERSIYHLQFTQWPDFGVPKNPRDILTFRQLVLSAHSKFNGGSSPIVVHCSAGVGRTGTFIALDHCIRRASHDRFIDLFETLSAMRGQRMLLVQTLSQYIFIYDALLLELEGHGDRYILY